MSAIRRNGWALVHEDGRPASEGEDVVSFRGEPMILADGSPPRHTSSTGRIYVAFPGAVEGLVGAEYYPSVCNLKWIQE